MSLYDLDTSWGTEWNGKELLNFSEPLSIEYNVLWDRFTKTFPNEIADRYFELRTSLLSKENVLNEFKTFANDIPKTSLEKENERWKNIPG